VQPANSGSGQPTELPVTAEGMVSRIGPVTGVAQIASISGANVYRSPFIPTIDTNGISVTAADPALPATLGATMAHGAFLNAATARYPAVVLGAEAATLLDITSLARPAQVWIGGHWFTVTGILNSVTGETQMDAMAFIGFPVAGQYFAFDGHPTELFVRTVNDPAQVNAVYNVLAATVNPANPSAVSPTEAASALQAEILTAGAYNGLFLALGAVALLVGGVGIANVMVISVLERRSEIGLRRALGATRRHHLRPHPALGGADPRPGHVRRHHRRPGHRRHRRPVPRHPGRPPVTHRGTAHRMTARPDIHPRGYPLW
jgi:putative ABC transport system permease protein